MLDGPASRHEYGGGGYFTRWRNRFKKRFSPAGGDSVTII